LFALASSKILDQLLAETRFERRGDTLALDRRFDPTDPQTVATASGITAGLLMPAVTKTREAAGRVKSQNNLKMLALGMHAYHDATGTFPAWAVYSKDGKRPLLSWRVALLPYLEQGELYKQFKFDEPWDSEHNKRLVSKMPAVFANAEAPPSNEPGLTHYQVFVGGGAPFRFDARGIRVVDVTDGTSNTIMIATATDPVPWTKPEDLTYSARKPVPKLGLGGKPANVALFDGSVRALSAKLSDRTLRSAITSSGNELLGDDW
jgi:prepilin-type processing-associated H-X9-DG protein